MRWDTRNFGQKLGAGLGAGMQDLAKLMLILQGQKREDAQRAQEQANWQKAFDFQKEQAQPSMPTETYIRPEAGIVGPGGMGMTGGDYQVPPLMRTPPTQPRETVQQAEPYKPLSAPGKQLYDEIMMGLPPGALNVPEKKTKPKLSEIPNIVGSINRAFAGEEGGRSKTQIFNEDYRHQIPALQKNYPDYFGPNAADSVLQTALHGSVPPAGMGLIEFLGLKQPDGTTAPPATSGIRRTGEAFEVDTWEDFLKWYNSPAGRDRPDKDIIYQQAKKYFGK